jgi:hypothetical protein
MRNTSRFLTFPLLCHLESKDVWLVDLLCEFLPQRGFEFTIQAAPVIAESTLGVGLNTSVNKCTPYHPACTVHVVGLWWTWVTSSNQEQQFTHYLGLVSTIPTPLGTMLGLARRSCVGSSCRRVLRRRCVSTLVVPVELISDTL